YNWYDTRTLKPLHPTYVSTVDSGNLAASLIILREGLLELGREDLAEYCSELLSPMSFSPLYDESHHLFSIGMDTDKEIITNSFYDLMASEARTAGYIAIARGDVPRRHWRSLSRAQVEKDGYRGMVSWTGSMFEYLMPRLFFESTEGSLMYESMKFAVEVQKKRGQSKHLPWGISESAFYALDPALNYRYKAHGCGALALKRNMNREFVVSPYSSFLALCCGVKDVVANLRRIERYDAVGKYGFWEAIDFTEGRSSGSSGEVVYCVMAHHLGMSLIAITNALCGNIMPHRLMRDPSMSAHACLLDEKLPLGGVILHRKENRLPEKPSRTNSVYWESRGDFVDFEAPRCCLLSNGEYSVMLTDSGVSHPICGDIAPYFVPKEIPIFDHGIELFLKCESKLISLLPSPNSEIDAKFDWEFSFSDVKIRTEQASLKSQVSCTVSAISNGEKRVISINTSKGEVQNCDLIVLFRPLLASPRDYVNHPAFYNMGLHAKMLGNTLIVKRLKRDNIRESYLCFACSVPMDVSARREFVPGRGGLLKAMDKFVPSSLGWLTNPMVCAKIPIRLSPESESSVAIAIAVGGSKHEAYTSANRILAGDCSDTANFPAEFAAGLRMTDTQTSEAMDLLSALSYPAPVKSEDVTPKQKLWRFGISGDLPIIAREIKTDDDLKIAESLMKQHSFLKSLSFTFDLALITDEGGNYLRPKATALSELRRTVGNESLNIHIIDLSSDAECLIANSAALRERKNISERDKYIMYTFANADLQNYPQFEWLNDGSFRFYVNHSLPPRAWGNILTNGRFGFWATDCGTGHMWYKNAREYKINRWLCDSLSVKGSETAELNGETLFASPYDTDCTVNFGFGFAKWEKIIGNFKVSTVAFVPADTDARILITEWEKGAVLPLRWSSDLVLSGDDSSAAGTRTSFSENLFTSENPESPFPGFPFKVCSSAKISGYTTNKSLWLQGKTDNNCENGGFLGIVFEAESPFILVCGCDEDKKLKELCIEAAAFASLKDTIRNWRNTVSEIKIKTPLPSLDRLINGWLPYQTLACRLMGRCSIYQSGGATGFRDQLQDAVNILLVEPAYAKAQILECCRHQYEEGDVMHWWHTLEGSTKGVRTHCSDDLLWLPWALCEYVEKTGDRSICEIPVSWLTSHPLHSDERDRYEQAVYTEEKSAVIVHAQKALDMVLLRGAGAHGLLKIGSGDWNDGMDKIGTRGRGESVWLTWFFAHTADRFAQLLKTCGKSDTAEKYEKAAAELGKCANEAWDGEWYLRGYFDDGTPLGSASRPVCQIDSIAQSFSSLCSQADKERVNTALSSAVSRLFDRQNRLIRLFDPPFENSKPSPGYIESYGPGFRENGGQYTHGAVWLIMALLRENRSDEAAELIEALLPDSRDVINYEAEPYVLAADVSSNPDYAGKAGWSWFTGSSGWMYRVITEDFLGIKMRGGKIDFSPSLPESWPECEVTVKFAGGEEKSVILKGKTVKNK
ncbi:MAG: hypothetical protein GX488_01125, partial [Clostridiales bacterium]|nr:hypothetical protein [Clostridiales bacterium]